MSCDEIVLITSKLNVVMEVVHMLNSQNKPLPRLATIALFAVGLSGILCIHAHCKTYKYPNVYLDKVRTTPDLLQTDIEACFPDGGAHYGAPVAVSNSMMWLANHGFGRLCPPAYSEKQSHIALVNKLATQEYINTDSNGSGPSEVMRGIEKYISDTGYRCVKLEYQGWRSVPKRFNDKSDIPSLDWMKYIISSPAGGLFINVGYYTYSQELNTFNRVGGRWITAVGYGINPRGEIDPSVIIAHDPSARSGKTESNNYCSLVTINDGSMLTGAKGLPRPAYGYYVIQKGLQIPKNADVAIIDCAVGMVVGK
jgi:hypothetical protein